MIEFLKHVGDAFSVGALVAYFTGALPIVATLLTVIWTGLRIYEMQTVQNWVKGKKNEPVD